MISSCRLELGEKTALSLQFGGPPDAKDDESKVLRSSGHGSRAGGVSRRATKRSASVTAAMNMALAESYKISVLCPATAARCPVCLHRDCPPRTVAWRRSESRSLRPDSRPHFNAHERPKSEHPDPAGCAKMQISGNRNR